MKDERIGGRGRKKREELVVVQTLVQDKSD